MVQTNYSKYWNNLQTYTSTEVTISSGQTESEAVDLETKGITAILMPSAFTGTAITFSGSPDGTTYGDLYNSDNTQFSITIGTSRFYMLNPADFLGCRYVKIVSNASEGADRTLSVVTRTLE